MQSGIESQGLRERFRRILSPELKAGIASLLCHPVVGRSIAALSRDRIASGGLSIRTDNPAISPRTKAQIYWGIYESAEIRFVHRHLRGDRDVLELGSSLGVVSSHVLGRLSASSRMICVEANPALVPTIRANLSSNHPGRGAEVLNRALDYSGQGATTRLRVSGDTSASRLGSLAGGAGEVEVEVATTRVSKIVSEFGLRDYTLVSDVEGAEAGFVFADRGELEGCRAIIAELHDTDWQGRRVGWQDLSAELVARFGFRVVDGFGPVQVFER